MEVQDLEAEMKLEIEVEMELEMELELEEVSWLVGWSWHLQDGQLVELVSLGVVLVVVEVHCWVQLADLGVGGTRRALGGRSETGRGRWDLLRCLGPKTSGQISFATVG